MHVPVDYSQIRGNLLMNYGFSLMFCASKCSIESLFIFITVAIANSKHSMRYARRLISRLLAGNVLIFDRDLNSHSLTLRKLKLLGGASCRRSHRRSSNFLYFLKLATIVAASMVVLNMRPPIWYATAKFRSAVQGSRATYILPTAPFMRS